MTPLHRSRAHAFVADLDAPALDADDRHHFERVLRLARGEPVTVTDGRGRWRPCAFGPTLEPVGAVEVELRPAPAVAVAFALVKGDRPEWTVQKLTELGVDTIIPFHARRSVVHWAGDRAVRHIGRLRRVAREAAMQSRRTWLPDVADITSFDAVAGRPGALLAERDGRAPAAGDALVLVGPEGGWDEDERARGLPTVGLGPTVLRADTAAIAVGVLLTALRPGGALTAKGG